MPRSLPLKARRFESWQEIEAVAERAPAYWNARHHPFVRGRRRRHRSKRSPGVVCNPGASDLATSIAVIDLKELLGSLVSPPGECQRAITRRSEPGFSKAYT